MKKSGITECHSTTGSRGLALRGGSLGDLLLTLPALRRIRRELPGLSLTLATRSSCAELLVDDGAADRWLSLERSDLAGLFSSHPWEGGLLPYDRAWSWMRDPDGHVVRNLKKAGLSQVAVRDPSTTVCHQADHLEQIVGAVDLDDPVRRLPLRLSAATQQAGTVRMPRRCRPLVVIHPGSGSAIKNWPVDRFIRIAEWVDGAGYTPVFTIGEADAVVRYELERRNNRYPLLEGLSIREMAGLLSRAALYLGNDSGISHLAAVIGIRTFVVFGPTDPDVWAPVGQAVTVIRPDRLNAQALRSITAEQVWQIMRPFGAG
ncbi:MAG: hypothetical protein A2498_07515 [Lentisphaerae bacterium RIFOXYC12_FULL_60_16]|nr:MAG: hypothetical protein A2498_07515 [Lentisphaerae bacterium RIFOXYC12_FULL_60_16]OGV76803.1 MAG: hypothetical protein A2340_08055 [Lentisphaerae bacterium RIFOXYB12_FULL_60_10]